MRYIRGRMIFGPYGHLNFTGLKNNLFCREDHRPFSRNPRHLTSESKNQINFSKVREFFFCALTLHAPELVIRDEEQVSRCLF